MKFKDLKSVISAAHYVRVVVTCLAYFRDTKEYYSFRTAFDGEGTDELRDQKYAYMDDYDVKDILVGNREIWIDLIEWIE